MVKSIISRPLLAEENITTRRNQRVLRKIRAVEDLVVPDIPNKLGANDSITPAKNLKLSPKFTGSLEELGGQVMWQEHAQRSWSRLGGNHSLSCTHLKCANKKKLTAGQSIIQVQRHRSGGWIMEVGKYPISCILTSVCSNETSHTLASTGILLAFHSKSL